MELFPLGHFFWFPENPPLPPKGQFVTTAQDITQWVSKAGKTGTNSHKLRKGSKRACGAFHTLDAPSGLPSSRSALLGTIAAFFKGLPYVYNPVGFYD